MCDLFKLIWYAVAGLFWSRAVLQTEVLALRNQLNVLRRGAPRRLTVSNIDRLVFAGLYHLAPEVGRGENPQAGDYHQMASRWVPSLVALEIKKEHRSFWSVNHLSLPAPPPNNVLAKSQGEAKPQFKQRYEEMKAQSPDPIAGATIRGILKTVHQSILSHTFRFSPILFPRNETT
jgi:hypothetical protein